PHILTGIFSTGRKSSGIRGWMDADYYEKISLNKVTLNLQELGLDIQLFRKIGGLIPNGGSLMVSYEMFWGESEIHKDTSQALKLGMPPIITPIGYLIFRAGCWAGFKDWYFSEGGNEGPKKLQGFKPVDKENARLRAKETIKSLNNFIEIKEDRSELERNANKKSKEIIETLIAYRFNNF
ncbi:MAG: DUF1122 family protein, partial [Candidatus Methylarchaceae archaeon HK02M2]|nr:DUF1122 family protein [Candidatus Methylarchaceae archaeon HK02M2]